MSGHERDDERVAAFLDGRMDARRREEMLSHLTRSEEDRAVLIRTAAILRQLEEADAAAPAVGEETADTATLEGVIPLDARRLPRPEPGHEVHRPRARVLRWLAVAAVLACVALVTGRALRPSVGDEPGRLAARLAHGAEGLPPGWTEQRPWTSARGDDPGGARSPAERSAKAVRAGAMLVDLSVAVQAGDAQATRVLATQIAERFDSQGGRRGALRQIVDGAGTRPERLRPLVGKATERIAERLDPEALRLGAWTEAARLAAARRDAAFFRDRDTRRRLDQAARLTAGDRAAQTAVREVRLLLEADPPRWEALAPAIDVLARELAGD